MKKVLITGVAGFVGQHLLSYLQSLDSFEIVGTYRSESSHDEFDKKNLTLRQVNLMDQDAVASLIEEDKPDYIYHLAAMASAAKSYSHAKETLTNNMVVELNLLEALKNAKMYSTRTLIVSSGEVYGMVKPEELPVSEENPLRPVSPYAVSKIAQDFLAYQYFLSYHLDTVRVRPFNHTGPGQKEGYVVSDFAKQIVEIEKGKKEPVITVGNLEAKRDFTDVRDIVKAYHLALEKGEAGEVYNLGSNNSYKVADILQMLLAHSMTKVDVKVDPERFRPIDVPEITCDSRKFFELTHWKPEIEFERTLQDILDYWRKIV